MIELQKVTPSRTTQLASATTAADGSFTTAVTLAHNANLCALHPQAPASASEIVAVGIAPAVELKLESSSPLRVSGTVFPTKPTIELDVYALAHGHRRLLKSTHVAVHQGQITVELTLRARGRYAIRARTKADGSNLAGASNQLQIVI